MDKSRAIPVLSLLDSGETFIKAQDKFRFVVKWSILASGWLIVTSILMAGSIFLEPATWGPFTEAWFFVQILGGTVLVLFGPHAILYARNSAAVFNDFLQDFYPLWFKVKFELLPGVGNTIEERIVSKIRDLRILTDATIVQYGEPIEGKSGTHTFSVFLRRKGGPMTPGRVGFVRVFDTGTVVSREHLELLRSEALDVAARRGAEARLLVAVGRAGFEPNALEWARSPEGLSAKNRTNILLTEDGGVLQVAWIG